MKQDNELMHVAAQFFGILFAIYLVIACALGGMAYFIFKLFQ